MSQEQTTSTTANGAAEGVRRPLNELTRTDQFKGEPDRTIPDSVRPHYKQDGNSFRSAYHQDKIEFVDRGTRMHAYGPVSNFTARSMASVAEARGWKELEITGSDAFKSKAFVECVTRGIGVRGYEPTQRDLAALQRRDERAEAHLNPKVQAFLDAKTSADRDKAVKSYPELKAAFATEAAGQALAHEKLGSEKQIQQFMGRFRDSIALAVHAGRELPSVELKTDRQQTASDKDQGRSR